MRILQIVHVQLNATTVFGVKNEAFMYHLSDSNFHQNFWTHGIQSTSNLRDD